VSKVFVDTSAILAFLSRRDQEHERARETFEKLMAREAALLTTSYVLVETYALVDRRLGREAARRIRENLAPLLEIIWVDRELHERGLDAYFAGSRDIGLVDAVSFTAMRDRGIERAWTVDRHFADEGFEVLG
jgi:predicted nucleic acid-binding protein